MRAAERCWHSQRVVGPCQQFPRALATSRYIAIVLSRSVSASPAAEAAVAAMLSVASIAAGAVAAVAVPTAAAGTTWQRRLLLRWQRPRRQQYRP